MMSKEKKPNVIWVFGDQHRSQALGYNGDPNANTPNLDRFAQEGLNVTGAVSGFPLCCPFRGSMITGRYPHNCVPGHQYPLPQGQETIAHVLNGAGYDTAYFGKWHLDGFKEGNGRATKHVIPPERRGGFDTWVGYDNNNSQWDTWVCGNVDGEEVQYRLPGYETDCLTDMLIDYIGQEREKPFFAALSVQPPHDPYVAPPEFMEHYNPATLEMRPNVPEIDRVQLKARRELAGYYAQIENLDWNFGRIRECLFERGLDEDTHIIFFSDHGDMHGSHGQFRKTSPWQESISIPFIIGGVSLYGMRRGDNRAPINHVDIAPTTLGLCGVDVPDWMEGTDYSQLRVGKMENAPDSAYLQSVVPTGHGDSIDRPWRGVTTEDGWKYIALEGQPWLMFNLNEDPYEQANLAHNSMYRGKRKELNERLAKWIADTGDEFELPEL